MTVTAGRARVLVVEDDADQRDTIAAILRDAGFDVGEATDGRQALAECRQSDPDLIVLDLRLPNLDGPAFLKEYRQLPRSSARILVASARDDGAEASARGRADAYISKPFALDELLGMVRRVLARTRE